MVWDHAHGHSGTHATGGDCFSTRFALKRECLGGFDIIFRCSCPGHGYLMCKCHFRYDVLLKKNSFHCSPFTPSSCFERLPASEETDSDRLTGTGTQSENAKRVRPSANSTARTRLGSKYLAAINTASKSGTSCTACTTTGPPDLVSRCNATHADLTGEC